MLVYLDTCIVIYAVEDQRPGLRPELFRPEGASTRKPRQRPGDPSV